MPSGGTPQAAQSGVKAQVFQSGQALVDIVLGEEDAHQTADSLVIAGGIYSAQTHLAACWSQFSGQQLEEDIRSTVKRAEDANHLTAFDLKGGDLKGKILPEDLLQVGNLYHRMIVAFFEEVRYGEQEMKLHSILASLPT